MIRYKGAMAAVWSWWCISSVTGGCFGAMSISIFKTLSRMKEVVDGDESEIVAVLFASFATAFALVVFTTLSFCAMRSESFAKGRFGFGHGFLAASAGSLGILCFSTGLAMSALKEEAQDFENDERLVWTRTNTDLLKITSWFGYSSGLGYMILGSIMALSFAALQREEEDALSERLTTQVENVLTRV